MKIIVLHGEDTDKSYKRLAKFIETAKSRNWEIVDINSESKLSIGEFVSTPSLFGGQQLFILRNYQLLDKKDLKILGKLEGNFVIYHEGELPTSFLKLMPQEFKMEKYDLPKTIFIFLDSLYPGNSLQSIKLLHDLVKVKPVELIFSMISRHFRDLLWIKLDGSSAPFPSWKVGKLRSQASKFSLELLKRILKELSDIDISVKTSKSDLLPTLDLLIIKQLE